MSKSKVILIITYIFLISTTSYGQKLHLRARKSDALSGSAFALSISDSNLTIEKREKLIFKEIKKGNVPDFLRNFKEINQNEDHLTYSVTYYVLPDYFAVGSNTDFFYVPMTPILAQKVAKLLRCTLPTKKMVDTIYNRAIIKLEPKPIPPTKAMTTVPVFISHNKIVYDQLSSFFKEHSEGALTAGNKKDIILSNKIYTEKTAKVVIYGWHQLNAKPIQPVYNKHTNLWADYSHGVRFVAKKVILTKDRKKIKTTVQALLNSEHYDFISDEGRIAKAFYPITAYSINK